MLVIKSKSDFFGALASTLCLIHCVATPFFFMFKSCAKTCCAAAPFWWQLIDYFFLIISLLAISQVLKKTQNNWVKLLFLLSWFTLFFVIINQKTGWFTIDHTIIYYPTLSLIILHIYNSKYCQYNKNKCCTYTYEK
ncbi:MerC domain-containing protein [Tenacibaculum salmonis]|uniref:MerC domain-containing protein n=1 Tax=Tenacibaculum sp. P3-BQ1 TaxID=3232310 RepID=UPI0034E018A0